MQIKVDEISKILRQQIEGYERQTDLAEIGHIVSVGDGIGRIYGLEKAMSGELLELPHDVMGMALNLEEDSVGAVLLGETTLIKEGDQVRRTRRIMQVPAGEALIGPTRRSSPRSIVWSRSKAVPRCCSSRVASRPFIPSSSASSTTR